MIEMKPTRMEHCYDVTDEGGYRWHVVAQLDPEFGWEASVTMTCRGRKTPEDAIGFLRTPARRFVEAMDEAARPVPWERRRGDQAMSKIAPLLTKILKEECGPSPAGRALASEIRAVIAVARAAQRDIAAAKKIHGTHYDMICRVAPTVGALDRALSRLARPSAKKGAAR